MLSRAFAAIAVGVAAHQARPIIKGAFSRSYPGGIFALACYATGYILSTEVSSWFWEELDGARGMARLRSSMLLGGLFVGLGVMLGYWLDTK